MIGKMAPIAIITISYHNYVSIQYNDITTCILFDGNMPSIRYLLLYQVNNYNILFELYNQMLSIILIQLHMVHDCLQSVHLILYLLKGSGAVVQR